MFAYVVLIFLVVIFFSSVHAMSGTFYADNGREQTVLYKTLAQKDKIELQEEVLNLLGLDHRPHKSDFIKHHKLNHHKSSAEMFMLDLHRTLEEGENFNNKSDVGILSDSDFVVSFSNKSNHFY